METFRIFPDDATAEAWFVKQRWPEGVSCVHCGSLNVQSGAKHKTMPYRCRDCRKRFSVKTGTVMQGSKLGFQVWAVALYLLSTNLKSVSSMKLHRDLSITQKSAWHLAHRIREAMATQGNGPIDGPVEVDETYFGGEGRYMRASQREGLEGRAPVSKASLVSTMDSASYTVRADGVSNTIAESLKGIVVEQSNAFATAYSDDATAYQSLPYHRKSVNHSISKYVRGQAHSVGVKSLWSTLKRAKKGVFNKLSPMRLDRYIQEVASRHNVRELDTLELMGNLARRMVHQWLRRRGLAAAPGAASGARA